MTRGQLVVLLAVLVAALFACFLLSEYDVCWHLRAGQWILAHGEVPRADAFSHTVPGKPWLDFEWLAQAVFYVLAAAGGLDALIAFKMTVTALAFLCVALTARRLGAPSWLVAGTMMVAVLAAHERFYARPDMFTNLAVAWTVFAYEGLARGRRGPALTLPLVQVFWVNLHGGFILGPLLGVAFAVGQGLNLLMDSPRRGAEVPAGSRGALAWTLGLAGASALACLVNPYGLALVMYPLREIPLHPGPSGGSIFLETIAEWQSPFASLEFGHPMTMAFYAWTGLWCLVLPLRMSGIDFRGICVALGTFVLAFSGRRHIAVFAIASAPFLAAELWRAGAVPGTARRLAALAAAAAYALGICRLCSRACHGPLFAVTLLLPAAALAWPLLSLLRNAWGRAWPSTLRWGGGTWALAVFQVVWVLALVSNRFNEAYGNGRVFGFGADAMRYPEGAVRYLERHRLHGRLFNNLAAGGFLAWRAPEHPVFIDGRNLLYGEAFYREYLQALSSEAAWRRLETRYDLSLVLVSEGEALGNFVERMLGNPAWRLVYADHLSHLFVRRSPSNAAMLARLPEGVDSLPLSSVSVGPPPGLLSRMARRLQRVVGTGSVSGTQAALADAVVLQERGDFAEASRRYAAILSVDPGNLRALWGSACLYERLNQPLLVERACRRLLAMREEPRIHVTLGNALLRQGRREEALQEYALADPSDPRPFSSLAEDALARGDPFEALALFEKAVARAPQDAGILCSLASALEALGRRDEAVEALKRALGSDPHGQAGPRLVAYYAEGLGREPRNAALANNLGTVYHAMGAWHAAEAWYRKALLLDPGLAGVRGNLASLAQDRRGF